MRRSALGLIALLFLITGAVFYLRGGDGSNSEHMVAGSSIRAGMMLGAIWLAWPQIQDLASRTPWWLVCSALLLCGLVAARPKTIVIAGPLLVALLVMKWFGKVLRAGQSRVP